MPHQVSTCEYALNNEVALNNAKYDALLVSMPSPMKVPSRRSIEVK